MCFCQEDRMSFVDSYLGEDKRRYCRQAFATFSVNNDFHSSGEKRVNKAEIKAHIHKRVQLKLTIARRSMYRTICTLKKIIPYYEK